jgi:nucleoside-diphosphate-sugar epimerase
MRILVTGGGGFLGRRLIQRLLRDGLAGEAVSDVRALDSVSPAPFSDDRVRVVAGDLGDDGALAAAIGDGVDVAFHLAAVVSGAAEADLALGMRVNVDGTRALLDALAATGGRPRLVFASSVAAFGRVGADGFVDDATTPKPASSYGAEKVIGEYLVADRTRRGDVDGRSVRLPTVVVRPGKPNAAASSFASSILREPLAGAPAVLPVAETLRLWISSPDTVVGNLAHTAALPQAAFEGDATLNLPGITVAVAEMIAALGRAGGDTALVERAPDARIGKIVASWPAGIRTVRADALGFRPDSDIDAIVAEHVAAMKAA